MCEEACQPRIKIWKLCLLSVALVCLLVLAVYAVRGIYPFGTENIAYVDDAQYYVPGLYERWDYLHGEAARSINWFAGLAEGSSGYWSDWINPANWVFLLLPRDAILEGLSLYLLVYLMLIAAVAGFVLGKRFPHIGLAWGLILTLLYTLSGFVLQYYSIFGWMYNVLLFPLLLLGLEKLLRDGKFWLYAVVYAVYLQHSIYISYMVSLYVIFFSFWFVLFVLDKDKRGDRILRLGLSTAGALGVTAYSWLSSSVALASTSRFQSNVDQGVLDWMSGFDARYLYQTFLMLLGMELLIVVLARTWRATRGTDFPAADARRRTGRFYAGLFITLLVPMVFQNIDTMWHFGPYNFFAMRYGYMLPATVISAAGLCLEHQKSLPSAAPPVCERVKKKNTVTLLFAGLCAGGALLVMSALARVWQKYGTCFLYIMGNPEAVRYWALVVCAAVLWGGAYFFALRLRKTWTAWLLLGLVILQLGANAFGLLGPDDSASGYREYDDAYIHEADALYTYFSAEDYGILDRAKNVDASLNGGYPAIAGISALSSVNSSNSGSDLAACRNLGYTTNYFMLLDTGGTVFTDMLLGVKYILSQTGLEEVLYTYAADVGETTVGLANYTVRQGLVYSAGALSGYADCETIAGRLNCLYAAFTGEESLARDIDAACSVEGGGIGTFTLTFEAGDAEFVYLAVNGAAIGITVNGRSITVPSYGDLSSTTYPSQFNSNLLYLGCFENETVTISFRAPDAQTAGDLTLLGVDRAAIERFDDAAFRAEDFTLTEENGRLTVTAAVSDENTLLYLPLRYSGNWACTVNGKAVTPEPVMDGLTLSIPLEKGENTITVERAGKALLSRGNIISAVMLALVLIYLLLRRAKCKWAVSAPPKALCSAALWVFAVLCAGVFMFIYLGPLAMLIARG